jgi:hypothetical protein
MAMSTSESLLMLPQAARLLQRAASLSVATLVAAITLVAVVFLGRGLSGALLYALDFTAALIAGAGVGIAAAVLRRLVLAFVVPTALRRALLRAIVASAAMLVVALSLSPMTNLSLVALWIPVIAAEAFWWVTPAEESAGTIRLFPASITSASRLSSSPALAQEPPAFCRPSPSENLLQEFTRVQGDGVEIIGGRVAIRFAAQEQTAVLHLSFCPPLASDPVVAVRTLAADSVVVKAAECRSYGLRLEAKRGREVAAPLLVRVEYEARG